MKNGNKALRGLAARAYNQKAVQASESRAAKAEAKEDQFRHDLDVANRQLMRLEAQVTLLRGMLLDALKPTP